MAGASLLTLLDDIASILDDVSILTKKAASKTAGVLADDLALNAEQVTGVVAKRELPVVWGVAKGSFINKLILVPGALLLNAYVEWLLLPLLMLGGSYLCYEGVEKLIHSIKHRRKKTVEEAKQKIKELEAGPPIDEKAKIRGAVRTDFILSAEIIVIALNVVREEPFATQAIVLSVLALAITIGIYGFVALIVKLDDIGLYLSKKDGASAALGRWILWFAPWLVKTLSVVGTAAMFLVGGGILVHGITPVYSWIEHVMDAWPSLVETLLITLFNGIFGVVAGLIILSIVHPIMKKFGKAH